MEQEIVKKVNLQTWKNGRYADPECIENELIIREFKNEDGEIKYSYCFGGFNPQSVGGFESEDIGEYDSIREAIYAAVSYMEDLMESREMEEKFAKIEEQMEEKYR